eukprot:2929866-Rhodomonas_salina.2
MHGKSPKQYTQTHRPRYDNTVKRHSQYTQVIGVFYDNTLRHIGNVYMATHSRHRQQYPRQYTLSLIHISEPTRPRLI